MCGRERERERGPGVWVLTAARLRLKVLSRASDGGCLLAYRLPNISSDSAKSFHFLVAPLLLLVIYTYILCVHTRSYLLLASLTSLLFPFYPFFREIIFQTSFTADYGLRYADSFKQENYTRWFTFSARMNFKYTCVHFSIVVE